VLVLTAANILYRMLIIRASCKPMFGNANPDSVGIGSIDVGIKHSIPFFRAWVPGVPQSNRTLVAILSRGDISFLEKEV
jgi:hypothetical protein